MSASQKFRNYGKFAVQFEALIDSFGRARQGIIDEGRQPHAQSRLLMEAGQKYNSMLKTVATEALQEWIGGFGKARGMIKPSKDFAARQYYLAQAQALTAGKSGQQLLAIYRTVIDSPEAREFNNEFATLIAAQMKGTDYELAWQELHESSLTEEEREQQQTCRALELLKTHMKTLENLAKDELQTLGKGEARNWGLRFDKVFEGMLRNIEEQLSSPQQRKTVEVPFVAKEVPGKGEDGE